MVSRFRLLNDAGRASNAGRVPEMYFSGRSPNESVTCTGTVSGGFLFLQLNLTKPGDSGLAWLKRFLQRADSGDGRLTSTSSGLGKYLGQAS
ncbi:hypothetical protein chiPu_0007303 [Chiloscyllium punctatum]|uniref:Uncharacterized protein n=1 Tax=Chiloscyllium punctatum TaxID=137246 RepID=A0A401SEP4_CHIPU|nr:hypothetical protein [Chiloscyllium punctatum]